MLRCHIWNFQSQQKTRFSYNNSESGDHVMIGYQMFKKLERIAQSGSMKKAAVGLSISRPLWFSRSKQQRQNWDLLSLKEAQKASR